MKAVGIRNVVTMDPRHPRARAVVVAGGRFIAVGADRDVRNLATAGTRVFDLGGQTVVPGSSTPTPIPPSPGGST